MFSNVIWHENQTTARVIRVRECSENVAKAVTYVEEEPLIFKSRIMKKERLKKNPISSETWTRYP